MKTLLSINNYYYKRGGAEVVFLEQNRMFTEAGWKVVPFCMHHQNNMTTKWADYFVDEIEFGTSYSLMEKLRRIPKVIYSKEAQNKIRKLIQTIKPDIAHAHNIYHHISPSILPIISEYNIPLVMTLHDLKVACPAYKMLTHDGVCERCNTDGLFQVVKNRCVKSSAAISTMIYFESLIHKWLDVYQSNVDVFVAPSKFYRDKLIEWGMNSKQIEYVPNFVDVENIKPNYQFDSEFIYFGRLASEKGLSTLIKAVAQANVKLCIVGTGPEETNLKNLAQKLNAQVSFVGYKTGKELEQLIQSARATIIPSEWYENAPMTILESYALGTPVIGANIGGIPELIRDGETGYIFSAGNYNELADLLIRMSQETELALSDLARQGREWVEQEFNKQLYMERLKQLYTKLETNKVNSLNMDKYAV